MHEKLEHAQKILEAVVTSDWVGLETHSRELEQLTKDQRWYGSELTGSIRRYASMAIDLVAVLNALRTARQTSALTDFDVSPQVAHPF